MTDTTILRDELHGLSNDGRVVITVQWWKPNVLVVFRNGRRADRRTGPVAAVAAEVTAARAGLAATTLTDAQARAKLAELTGTPADDACPAATCGALLPIGGYRCVRCGTFPARHAAGALSGATRRGPILLRITP